MNENENTLSTRQAALLIGVHESSVKRWCNGGELACALTEGGHRRIALGTLLGFARERAMAWPLLDLAPAEAEAGMALLAAVERGAYGGLVEMLYGWLQEGSADRPIRLLVLGRHLGLSTADLCDRVIAPVMRRVGEDWFDGRITVGDEHRMTQIVLDTLHALRSAAPPPAGGAAAVVGCDAGNRHEVGAQMVRLALEEAGWRVFYLGSDVPVDDFAGQQQARRAGLVCISFAPPQPPAGVVHLVRSLARLYEPARPFRLALGGSPLAGTTAIEAGDLPFAESRAFDSIAGFTAWLNDHPANR